MFKQVVHSYIIKQGESVIARGECVIHISRHFRDKLVWAIDKQFQLIMYTILQTFTLVINQK